MILLGSLDLVCSHLPNRLRPLFFILLFFSFFFLVLIFKEKECRISRIIMQFFKEVS